MFESLKTTKYIGSKLEYMPTCHSTNAVAMQMLKEGKFENGMVIITDDQTAGKGQRGNQWQSEPAKNLTFSVIIDISSLGLHQLFNLNMVVSLAILSFLKELQPTKSKNYFVKWPNDMYFDGNKLGGILIETLIRNETSKFAVVGIGLNINQIEFGRLNATSLKKINEKDFVLQEVLEMIGTNLESELIKLHDFPSLKSEYLVQLLKFNILAMFKKINDEIVEGIIKDIDSSGKIEIEINGSSQLFDKQEIKFINS